jgi:hypothetical protein
MHYKKVFFTIFSVVLPNGSHFDKIIGLRLFNFFLFEYDPRQIFLGIFEICLKLNYML